MNRARPGSYDLVPPLYALLAAASIVAVAAHVLQALGGFV